MKGNEEVSARALAALLGKIGLECSYKPVEPANDFPDFEFAVSGERWAVECTDLHQYIDDGGKSISRVGVDKGIERLCESIRAKAQPGVNRKYLISAFGPGLSVTAQEIERRAIEYIESGKTECEALDVPEITERDHEIAEIKRRVAEDEARVHICAVTEDVPIVYMYGLDGTVRNADGKTVAADIKATLRFGVERILADKLPKLAQCQSHHRRILLVWLGHWVAEPRHVKEVLDELKLDRAQLDTFLLVLPNGEVHWVADPGEVFTGPSG